MYQPIKVNISTLKEKVDTWILYVYIQGIIVRQSIKSYNLKLYYQVLPISGDIKVIEINITMLSKLRWFISAIILVHFFQFPLTFFDSCIIPFEMGNGM